MRLSPRRLRSDITDGVRSHVAFSSAFCDRLKPQPLADVESYSKVIIEHIECIASDDQLLAIL